MKRPWRVFGNRWGREVERETQKIGRPPIALLRTYAIDVNVLCIIIICSGVFF